MDLNGEMQSHSEVAISLRKGSFREIKTNRAGASIHACTASSPLNEPAHWTTSIFPPKSPLLPSTIMQVGHPGQLTCAR